MYKENQFIFTSAWSISKIYEKALRILGNKKKLTQCEMDVLIFLYVNAPQNTSKDIAEFRSISKSLICKSVASLVDKGMLLSESDVIDARVLRLTLTDSGEKEASELVTACDKLCSDLSWGISNSELDFVGNVLSRMKDNGKKYR